MADASVVANKDAEKAPFSRKQVKLATSALLAHLKDQASQKSNKNELFQKDDSVWLLLGLRKIPQVDSKPKKIPLPHSIHKESVVCLISTEPGKVVKEKLKKHDVTCVKKVISLTKLRKEFKTFALKRQLVNSYDLFMCDDRIYHLVVKSLGKEFFKRKKEPIPIRLTYQDWKTEISKSLNSTLLRMGHGPCSAIRVGKFLEHTERELTANVIHAMKVSARKVPGCWKNIKSFHIKSCSSVSLPVYQTSPLGDVRIDEIPDHVPEVKKRKRKRKQTSESEEVKEVEKVEVPARKKKMKL